MKTPARFLRHLLFASAILAAFVWLAPWRLVAPPPEPPRIQRLLYPTFHLRPHEDPYRNSIYDPVLQASKPIDAAMAPLQSGVGFYLVPGDPLPWNDQYTGRKVRLYNNTREIKNIPTSDYALFVIAEAMDSEGRWRAIEEYLAISCDFSYFTVELEPNHYWEFTVPIYEGSFRTRMRYALSMGGDLVIYSEEFESSVEPELLGTAYGVETYRPEPRIFWKRPGTTQPL
jgi:hypothetical protein